ncbi:MAG: type III secretion system translocon subunit SctB, partial [Deltaproteobacteria bacterium]|nr:type III secretion system translocon subunit SctB [Deltaproteobacteria bacterium]
MLDIVDASKKFGLTQAQTEDIQTYYQNLSETEKTQFSQADFLKLVEARGYKAKDSSEAETPALKESSLKTPASATELMDLLRSFSGGISPGALVMALLTETAAEQREANKELKAAQVEATAKEIEKQAEVMMEKAVIQLALGVTAGAISIGSGISGAVQSAGALKAGLSPGDAALKNTFISSQQQVAQGGGSILGA